MPSKAWVNSRQRKAEVCSAVNVDLKMFTESLGTIECLQVKLASQFPPKSNTLIFVQQMWLDFHIRGIWRLGTPSVSICTTKNKAQLLKTNLLTLKMFRLKTEKSAAKESNLLSYRPCNQCHKFWKQVKNTLKDSVTKRKLLIVSLVETGREKVKYQVVLCLGKIQKQKLCT